ncbi:MAG: peptidoglycan DD-metalloendopeptidase family protein [Actinobacteria bacterium]|nr:peptidoglycan DD-metalloendopeptidase family protein [Actinomycetota bacterium]
MLKKFRPFAELSLVEWKRTRPRVGLVLTVAILLLIAPGAAADEFVPGQPFDPNQIVFPVVGSPVTFIDDFYQPRSGGRTHGATDIMTNGIKGWPVVAAADGVVTWIGTTCCYLALDHGGGYETWYIHLNNDTPGTDDGLGWGLAVTEGTVVTQGQLIGWVGDSGNAEWVAPHLHFEIRLNDVPINPYTYLLAAPHLSAPGGVAVTPAVNTFTDDDGNPHEANIEILFANGITVGCGAGLYCPLAPITRGQIALFIDRLLVLPAATGDHYDDDNGSIYEAAANSITQSGIGFGCGERAYCPEEGLRRDEMAELLTRTFGLAPATTDYFTDDDSSGFEAAINALYQAGITIGCDPDDPGLYCPSRILTRDEMATFFVRAMDL